MPFAHKLAAFDLDGTLTKSRVRITPAMSELVSRLCAITRVAVISGGSMEQFEKQFLGDFPPNKNLIILPTDGAERFEYNEAKKKWEMTDLEPFSKFLRRETMRNLNEIIESGNFDIPKEHYGEYIDDRITEVSFSALGRNAPLDKKESWDPDHSKRQKIKEEIERRCNHVSAIIGGTTTIDILPKGFNKAIGLGIFMEKFQLEKKDVVFVGDALFPGGNDYSVFEAGIETIKVNGPDETAGIIQQWIS